MKTAKPCATSWIHILNLSAPGRNTEPLCFPACAAATQKFFARCCAESLKLPWRQGDSLSVQNVSGSAWEFRQKKCERRWSRWEKRLRDCHNRRNCQNCQN